MVNVTFRRFEDIRAWQTARALKQAVYAATEGRAFKRDFGLRDQIRRAAISVMANIAEGFGCRSDKEFAKFLIDAKSSIQELESHLYAASDEGYVTGEQFKRVYSLAELGSRQLANLISFLLGRKSGPVNAASGDSVDNQTR